MGVPIVSKDIAAVYAHIAKPTTTAMISTDVAVGRIGTFML
jgi:hypothetical protein